MTKEEAKQQLAQMTSNTPNSRALRPDFEMVFNAIKEGTVTDIDRLPEPQVPLLKMHIDLLALKLSSYLFEIGKDFPLLSWTQVIGSVFAFNKLMCKSIPPLDEVSDESLELASKLGIAVAHEIIQTTVNIEDTGAADELPRCPSKTSAQLH